MVLENRWHKFQSHEASGRSPSGPLPLLLRHVGHLDEFLEGRRSFPLNKWSDEKTNDLQYSTCIFCSVVLPLRCWRAGGSCETYKAGQQMRRCGNFNCLVSSTFLKSMKGRTLYTCMSTCLSNYEASLKLKGFPRLILPFHVKPKQGSNVSLA